MGENEFDGSRVLEMLAAADLKDEFFEAVDADDFARARSLLRRAGVDAERITWVLQEMMDSD